SPWPHGKPSIAVLPFDNLSGDAADDWLANGIAEDLIAALSRSRFFVVISRRASFTFKGRGVDVRQVGRDLGARYVVEGSVRRSGDRLRVVSQLIEVEHQASVWTERYDRALTDLFAIQDEIASSVSHAIEPAVESAERRRILRKRPNNLDAWEAWQRAKSHFDAEQWDDVDAVLRRSIELDPKFALAHADRAYFLYSCILRGRLPYSGGLAEVEAASREAIRLDPTEPRGYAMLSIIASGDSAAALGLAERAVELGPSDWIAQVSMANANMRARRFVEAERHLKVLHRLNPLGTGR